jgi:hypothetical protein
VPVSDVPNVAWTAAVVAWVAAVPLWRFSTHAITVAHEGGHALFGLLFGGRVHRITISGGGAGETVLTTRGLARFMSLVAGYLGPSLFGFVGATMLVHDVSPRVVLFLSLVFLVGVLVMIRNLFGLLVVVAIGALLWLVTMRAAAPVQQVFAYIWVWFMLMGGARQIPELFWGVKAGDTSTDPALLERHTHVSDVLWLGVFWLGSVAALIYGGALLLRYAT